MGPKTDRKVKALVVVLNETRGSKATIQALLETGLSHVDWTLAYCGAREKVGANPYSSVADYIWEYEEPANWFHELHGTLPRRLYSFFLEPETSDYISTSRGHSQLWVSAWIQNIFRFRALEKITSLGLEAHFDWIFLVRSDYFFTSPFVPPRATQEQGLVFMVGDSYGGLNDRFMGIPSRLVAFVREALDYTQSNFVGKNDELFHFLRGPVSKNPETLIWFQLDKAGLLEGAYFVGQMGFCARLNDDSSRWSTGFWSGRRALYVKYPTELLLSQWLVPFVRQNLSPKLLFFLAKISRVAGTQPRLFLAPMLALQGELELGLEVFRKSRRESKWIILQLGRDVLKIFGDVFLVLVGSRKWDP